LSESRQVVSDQSVSENATRPFIHTTTAEAEPQKSLADSAEKQSFFAKKAARPLIAAGILILLLGGSFFGYRYFRPAAPSISSIAVMPFVNDSGNAELDYLSDGMTETLISSLSRLESLSVKPRSVVFRYRGRDIDPAALGKELGVQAILTGRVVS